MHDFNFPPSIVIEGEDNVLLYSVLGETVYCPFSRITQWPESNNTSDEAARASKDDRIICKTPSTRKRKLNKMNGDSGQNHEIVAKKVKLRDEIPSEGPGDDSSVIKKRRRGVARGALVDENVNDDIDSVSPRVEVSGEGSSGVEEGLSFCGVCGEQVRQVGDSISSWKCNECSVHVHKLCLLDKPEVKNRSGYIAGVALIVLVNFDSLLVSSCVFIKMIYISSL